LVEENKLGELLAQDQLSLARKNGQAFGELQETLPAFPPSYKYKIGTSDYDGKRLPAWTDRVLFKANVANYDSYKLSLRQHSYNAHQHFMQSDHKPVTSQFSGAVFSAATATSLLLPKYQPIVQFVDTGPHYCNEDLSIVYTVRMEERRHLNSWDWIGVFRVSESNLEDHLAYTWASTRLVRDAVYEVVLDMTMFPAPGLFRLVYFSSGAKDILGWSDPLQMRHRQYPPPLERAQEAKEL
jgi:inositol-1,4,5-trisphosphate 5-phosphatase